MLDRFLAGVIRLVRERRLLLIRAGRTTDGGVRGRPA